MNNANFEIMHSQDEGRRKFLVEKEAALKEIARSWHEVAAMGNNNYEKSAFEDIKYLLATNRITSAEAMSRAHQIIEGKVEPT